MPAPNEELTDLNAEHRRKQFEASLMKEEALLTLVCNYRRRVTVACMCPTLPRRASTIQTVRPLSSSAETQPTLNPAFIILLMNDAGDRSVPVFFSTHCFEIIGKCE
jgi:hypothetical protein